MKIFLLMMSIFFHSFNVRCMDLSSELWEKIIACCNSRAKNKIGKTCTELNKLYSKNNSNIYQHSPLCLTTDQKEYALSYCTYKQNISAVKNLLEHNAQTFHMHCGIIMIPLRIAQHHKNEQLINLLENYNQTIGDYITTPIQLYALAAYMGDLKALQEYVKSKEFNPLYENIDTKWKGCTLLYPAIYNGHQNVVTVLLTHKKTKQYINSGLKGQGKPIDIAFLQGNATVVDQLLSTFLIKMTTKDYAEKLYLCCKYGYLDCVKIILKKNHTKACINHVCFDAVHNIFYSKTAFVACSELSPLSIASLNGHYTVVKLLLRYKKINANFPHLKTIYYKLFPLYVAALNGHTSIVKLLLQSGKVKPLLFMTKYTALHIACKKGYLAIVKLLLAYCPILLTMKTTDKQKLPIELAQRYEHKKVISFLKSFNNKKSG